MRSFRKNDQQLAWSPGPSSLAVPLHPQDKTLTWEQYLDRLRERVESMLKDDQDGQQAFSLLWEERWGRYPDDLPRHLVSAEFEALLNSHGVRRKMFPIRVSSQREAVESIQELANVEDWGTQLLPSRE